jgi:predicted GH43/DUF377 family glycosyl hydrolase
VTDANSPTYAELLTRHKMNPILWAGDWPYPINTVFNAAATRLRDGRTLLLARVEDRRGISHLCAARSDDGINNWQIDPHPTFEPDPANHPEEVWGVEDPRIVWLEELRCYAVTYTSFSHGGPGVSIALTDDFKEFERRGVCMPPHDKDASLFPRRFDGRWAMIHRPSSQWQGSHIWISFSPDLHHWGNHTLVIEARRGAWWDADKIGLSIPPIETERGWLVMYHGVRRTPANSLYRLGLALLDLDNPLKCLRRSDEWFFGPEAPYERLGDVPDVVFPCGYTRGIDDPDALFVYYGAADTSIALATGSIRDMLDWLEQHGRPGDALNDDTRPVRGWP